MKILALALLLIPIAAFGSQAKDKKLELTPKDTIPITVASKGEQVRTVLMDIFDQEKKQYVIAPNIHFAVYLSLQNADFHRTLDIVCNLAGLRADLKDGIYFVHEAPQIPAPALAPKPEVQTPPHEKPIQIQAKPIEVKPIVPLGPVPTTSLQKHVTTRLTKADIRTMFADLSRQTGVKIVVDDKVPQYKLDAFLINTSLRYALNKVTKAAGLEWKLPPNHTVEITLHS